MSSKIPVPDAAEHNAFFPSEYSLTQYVPKLSDFDGADHQPITSGPRKILVIACDERYLPVAGGRFFSTGNHPVETLLPMMHLAAAGYEFEVATLSGNMAKLELWAFPTEDEAIKAAYEKYLPQFDRPYVLSDVVESRLGPDSEYAAVFIPGGHGATIGLPQSQQVKKVLEWALGNDRFVITLCHGPAALLAASDETGKNPLRGYELCVFPDALDEGANLEIGYLPGALTSLVAEELTRQGLTVLNSEMTGQVHRDRYLLTGDSPLASNALGVLSVEALREAYGA